MPGGQPRIGRESSMNRSGTSKPRRRDSPRHHSRLWLGAFAAFAIAVLVIGAASTLACAVWAAHDWYFIIGAGRVEYLRSPEMIGVFPHGGPRWAKCLAPTVFSFRFSSDRVIVPLFPVGAALLVLWCLCWRCARRVPRPGHCVCGYRLSGLRGALCPECGMLRPELMSQFPRA